MISERYPSLFPTQVTKYHSLALGLTCVALLSFILSFANGGELPGWSFESNSSKENEIDGALQQAATDALGQRDGVIIVMNARDGRIRAIVNSQGAFGTALMPGSTMKPFTALAGLRSGLIDEDSRMVCPGRFTGLGFSVACVHEDHLPPFQPAKAIAYSCNYYFATLGQRLGNDKLIETARQFGFGQPTGVAATEDAGLLRPCDSESRLRVQTSTNHHASEQSDCRARAAIGESDRIRVTPVQLLAAYVALINGGHLFTPGVAPATEFRRIERAAVQIAPDHRAIITAGMAGAVRYGTARSARLDSLPLTIIGKTGTALPAKGFRSNGWFIGFAGPFQNNREVDPSNLELAVLVLVARSHGSEAAMVAKPIFEAYANTAGRRGAESPAENSERALPAPARPASASSTIRIHLVHDNATQELPLEDYVLGVMRAEGTTESEPEALKALAISVRTYAVKNRGRHESSGYDFCSTTHCQRFVLSASGVTDTKLLDAVRATEGQVLRDERGQLVDAYFGASCGGETANIATLWGVNPESYLRGVPDEYCDAGPHATWTDVIAGADLIRALDSDPRTDVGSRLDRITVSKRDETGRAEFITLEGERPKTVRGWDFKIIVGRVLGWNVLKSSRFAVSRAGSSFVFHGSGFGHGLGLCQEGAHVMAARGMSYQRILQKYFPGTSVISGNQFSASLTNGAADLNAADAKDHAEDTTEDISGPGQDLRVPLRLVRSHHATTTISSEHFRVTYPSDVDRRDANEILRTLENALTDYLQRASAASILISRLPVLEIRMNESTGDFTGRTGQPWWAAAATKGNRIELQPAAILKRRGVLVTTLRHELAHVVIDNISRDRAPRWLEEGFAIYLAGEGRMFEHAARNALATDELERQLQHPRSQQNMRDLYAEAYRRVAEAVRQEGEASIWKKLAL